MRSFLNALYSGYATLVFAASATVAGILILVLPGLHLRRRAGAAGMHTFCRVSGIGLRIQNRDVLPDGPAAVVANHMSYLDGLVMTAALPPRFGFVIKTEAGRAPVVGTVLRRMGAAFVDRHNAWRGSSDTRRLLRLIQSGRSLGFFPEGGLRPEPGLRPFRLGAFLVAARTGVPIVPAVIEGTRDVLPCDRRVLHHGRIRVRLLPPLTAEGEDRKAAIRLQNRTWAAIHNALASEEARAATATEV